MRSAFKNMKMGKKLIGSFLFISLITAVVGGIGFFRISSNMAGVRMLVENDVQFLKQAEELKIFALQHRRYEKDFFLNIGKPEKQEGYIGKFKRVSGKTQDLLSSISDLIAQDPHLSDAVKAAVGNSVSAYQEYVNGFIALTGTVMADKTITPQAGNALMKPLKSHIYEFEKNVDVILDGGLKMVDEASAMIIAAGERSRLVIGILLVFGIVLSVALGLVLTRMITRPLNEVVSHADQMARGDFSRTIDQDRKDEIGRLFKAMNTMTGNLGTTLREVIRGTGTLAEASEEMTEISKKISDNSDDTAETARTVASAAEELSSNMDGVAAATEEAEASISMIVAAVEEMTSTIGEISKNTAKGSQITKGAVEEAGQVSQKVDALGRAAQAISKVTESIEDISEQTNLLALNATIEAARAGEAGKGFAVVAGEIKALAQQTAEATQEISQKISGIQTTTSESVEAIGKITAIIDEINDIVLTMSSAIEEQAATTQEISGNVAQAAQGVRQINESINESSTVTSEVTRDISGVSQAAEETRTGSNQVLASAEKLSDLAKGLSDTIKRFKV